LPTKPAVARAAATVWTIWSEPEEGPWGRKHARGWAWEIQRDFELRRVLVEVTGAAEAAAGATVRRVIETRGRSAIERVLAEDDPPKRITFTAAGRSEWPPRSRTRRR
jgi:hypothetical protein